MPPLPKMKAPATPSCRRLAANENDAQLSLLLKGSHGQGLWIDNFAVAGGASEARHWGAAAE